MNSIDHDSLIQNPETNQLIPAYTNNPFGTKIKIGIFSISRLSQNIFQNRSKKINNEKFIDLTDEINAQIAYDKNKTLLIDKLQNSDRLSTKEMILIAKFLKDKTFILRTKPSFSDKYSIENGNQMFELSSIMPNDWKIINSKIYDNQGNLLYSPSILKKNEKIFIFSKKLCL